MKRIFLASIFLFFVLSGCVRKKLYFEKTLNFPNHVTADQKVKLATYLIPSPQQYKWQRLELAAGIHFGINTFINNELDDETFDPAFFNPSDFNAEQWALAIKNAGFNMIILTAKYHDGFCLWPTKTTEYSVASSPWKNGKGDVVREVRNACLKYGLKFGVSLSVWDKNTESNKDSLSTNQIFIKQLAELLSNYGQIDEVRLSGYNLDGKVQDYNWQAIYKVIDGLQPKAVKAIMGNDVRWIGNKNGIGRESEWSVTPLNPEINETAILQNKHLKISPTSKDLGSRELIAEAKSVYWYPSETNISIRPGWFYHPQENNRVKTVQQLVDIYFGSVGMNSVLLLNIPPDKRGQLYETDVEKLRQFGKYIFTTFNKNKLANGNIPWTGKVGEFNEYNASGDTINVVMLQEDILKGQRIEHFKVDGFIENKWRKLTEGTTIGYKRLLRFENVAPSKIRITILATRGKANIKKAGAFYASPIQDSLNNLQEVEAIDNKWISMEKDPLIVDMRQKTTMKGFTFSPLVDSTKGGKLFYVFRISDNAKKWRTIAKGEFNITNNRSAQTIYFNKEVCCRYFQLETHQDVTRRKSIIKMNQIDIIQNK